MNLLCLTDLHGRDAALDRILKRSPGADVILLGGDLTHFGSPDKAEAVIRRAKATGAETLAVAGNCDSPEIDDRLIELGVSLFRRGAVRDGTCFYGVSAMPPWQGTMYELTEEEIAAALEKGRAAALARQDATDSQDGRACRGEVVLSHPPPFGILDRTSRGPHVGSQSLREFIDRVEPRLVVCGHIHEARGVETRGQAVIVNCGPASRGDHAFIRLNPDGTVDAELRTA
ncbi:MAG: metallophosphoesterase [Planctomycetales bacterium]